MTEKITKKSLQKELRKCLGWSREDSNLFISIFFEQLADAIKSGEKVNIKKIGTFRTINKKQRTGRNPLTRIEYVINERIGISFNCCKSNPTKQIINAADIPKISRQIANRIAINPESSFSALVVISEYIGKKLNEGYSAEFRGFGSFKARLSNSNINTHSYRFTPSKNLINHINKV